MTAIVWNHDTATVRLPARTLNRQRLTLTDRPCIRPVARTAAGRRIARARLELATRPTAQVIDCTTETSTDRMRPLLSALASLALVLAVVALACACALR